MNVISGMQLTFSPLQFSAPLFSSEGLTKGIPYSFQGNYSFLNLEIQWYIRPKVTVHNGAETIRGRKLYEGNTVHPKYNTPPTYTIIVFSKNIA